jgi:hypothetical protein
LQNDLARSLYASIDGCWEFFTGMDCDDFNGFSEGFTGRIAEICRGDVIPGKLCYDSHCSIPRIEGLTVGVWFSAWRR